MSSFLQVFRRTGMLPSTLSPLLVDGLSAWTWISIKVQHKKQSMTCNSNSFWVAIPSFDHLEISWWTPESGNAPALLHNNNETWNSREAQSQLCFKETYVVVVSLLFSPEHMITSVSVYLKWKLRGKIKISKTLDECKFINLTGIYLDFYFDRIIRKWVRQFTHNFCGKPFHPHKSEERWISQSIMHDS